MTELETGQIKTEAAEVYEQFFVPALFRQWPPRLLDAAGVGPGHRVLDVGCGTGVVARAAAERVTAGGAITGLDINEAMLAVARRVAPTVEWRQGDVAALPFEDATFDAVTCQFALMFFEDRVAAVREMLRVLRPDGRLAVATWDSLDTSPGYEAMVALLDRLFGATVADGLRAPFVLGDPGEVRAIVADAGGKQVQVQTLAGEAVFPSLEAWVYTDIRGWTMSDAVDDAAMERLVAAARDELSQFVQPDGQVRFAAPAHIATATKA